jgi:hypothetical protein
LFLIKLSKIFVICKIYLIRIWIVWINVLNLALLIQFFWLRFIHFKLIFIKYWGFGVLRNLVCFFCKAKFKDLLYMLAFLLFLKFKNLIFMNLYETDLLFYYFDLSNHLNPFQIIFSNLLFPMSIFKFNFSNFKYQLFSLNPLILLLNLFLFLPQN